MAQLSSLIFNTTRSKKEDTKELKDFLPNWEVEDDDMTTPEDQHQSLVARVKDRFMSIGR